MTKTPAPSRDDVIAGLEAAYEAAVQRIIDRFQGDIRAMAVEIRRLRDELMVVGGGMTDTPNQTAEEQGRAPRQFLEAMKVQRRASAMPDDYEEEGYGIAPWEIQQ